MMIQISEFSVGYRKQLVVRISNACRCNETQGTWLCIFVMTMSVHGWAFIEPSCLLLQTSGTRRSAGVHASLHVMCH